MSNLAQITDLNGRRVLIMFSGGLDSTHLLHAVLTKTDADVVAHHCELHFGCVNYQRAESRFVLLMRRWMSRNLRPFRLTSSSIDVSRIQSNSPHMIPLATIASLAAYSEGFGESDVILTGRNSSEDAETGPLYASLLARLKENAVAAAYAFGAHPAFTALDPPPTREQQGAELPDDLLRLVISCKKPIVRAHAPNGYAPCGTCLKCAHLRRALSTVKGAA